MTDTSLSFTRRVLLAVTTCLLVAGCSGAKPHANAGQGAPLWTEAERKSVKDYWSVPGRYTVADTAGGQRVNITVPGSTWYLAYTKVWATQPKETQAAWSGWFEKRRAADRARANQSSDAIDPGSPPPGFKDAVGEPPTLYERVQSKSYTVTFASDDAPASYTYTDALPFADRPAYYGYYRSTNGVRVFGRRVKDYTDAQKAQLVTLFARVAKSPAEQHVMQAVSALEGGFEAINTYDTGWVSIGFIQFITAINGDGSLASVLTRHKADDPTDFAQTFHRFGLDVTTGTPIIACVDPATGEEKRGADAVRTIIGDKRLTAVFQRAGERDGFRRAQIAVARERYWPGNDLITIVQTTLKETVQGKERTQGVYFAAPNAPLPDPAQAVLDAQSEKQKTDPGYRLTINPQTLTARVSDVFKSEAGLATLMDRKVNRGTLGPLNENAARLMQDHHLTKLTDLTRYERDLISRSTLR